MSVHVKNRCQVVIEVSLSPTRLIFHTLINQWKFKHFFTFFADFRPCHDLFLICEPREGDDFSRVFNVLRALVCVRGSFQEAIIGNMCDLFFKTIFIFLFLRDSQSYASHFFPRYVIIFLAHFSFSICAFLRCFGLLLSPGKNVKNSDMHLLDLVGPFFTFLCVYMRLLFCVC